MGGASAHGQPVRPVEIDDTDHDASDPSGATFHCRTPVERSIVTDMTDMAMKVWRHAWIDMDVKV